jgi:predicted dehydrogenase
MAASSTGDETALGVALLGFGLAGRIFHAPFIEATDGLRLMAIASRQKDAVAAAHPGVACVDEPEAAIDTPGVDLVVIATPNDTHARLARAALRAGRHVVVDKPFTITLGEAQEVVALARATGRRLSVFQNRRWDSDFLGVRQAIAGGVAGDVVELRSEISRWRPQVRDRWREREGPGSGLWYDLGPHLVDQAIVLFGRPERVTGSLRVLRAGGRTDDWFHVVLGYPGREVILTSSMLANDRPPRFIVRGTAGSLVKRGGDPQEQRLLAGDRPGGPGWGQDGDPLEIWRGGGGLASVSVPAGDYGRFYVLLRDAIRGAGEVPVAPADALTVMEIIEAGRRSTAEGIAVRLQPHVG